MRGRVLVIDDEQDVRDVLQQILVAQDLQVDLASTSEEALEALQGESYDVVLADYFLGEGMTGVDLCGRISRDFPDLPTIILTAYGNLEVAIAAIKADAYDFLTKPCRAERILQAVERALHNHRMRLRVNRLREQVSGTDGFGALLGESRAMQGVFHMLERAAATDLSVLVTGETGTGKELVALALHAHGNRRDQPFQAINCMALPENLLESELFGHEMGAFTDARAARKGLFLQAHGGTLFLDEIADMPLGLQGKLLRTLQERKVRQVGSDSERGVDVRVVAATNRDLKVCIETRSFREDLYYRLNVLNIRMPPLRERSNDVLLLAQSFLEEAAAKEGKAVLGLSSEAAARFLEYPWPGNVRELRNCVQRAVVLAEYEELRLADLPEEVRDHSGPRRSTGVVPPEDLPSLADLEQEHIARVLSATGGNKQKSARILGVDRSTLYRKMARYGIVWESPSSLS